MNKSQKSYRIILNIIKLAVASMIIGSMFSCIEFVKNNPDRLSDKFREDYVREVNRIVDIQQDYNRLMADALDNLNDEGLNNDLETLDQQMSNLEASVNKVKAESEKEKTTKKYIESALKYLHNGRIALGNFVMTKDESFYDDARDQEQKSQKELARADEIVLGIKPLYDK